MNRIILYASYEQYEYVNYYHLINNNEILLEYCPEERIDDIFQKIDNIKSEINNSEICIVQDENVTEWDYFQLFQNHNVELHTLKNNDATQLRDEVNTVLARVFNKDDDCENEKFYILFYGNAVFETDDCRTDEIPRQDEEILKYGEEEIEMTELTRIIKEKYERMNNHE